MLNIEFTKRLVCRIQAGNGGWMPSYMFYLNTDGGNSSSQLLLNSTPLTESLRKAGYEALNSAYASNDSRAPNMDAALGIGIAKTGSQVSLRRGKSLDSTNVDDSWKRPGDSVGGFKHVVVAQNFYNNLSTGNPELDSGLQTNALRVPYIVSPLDPAFPIDPLQNAVSPSLDLEISVEPEVKLASSDARPMLADYLRHRMIASDGSYYSVYSWNDSQRIPQANDNPYLFANDYISYIVSHIPYIMTSGLEVDDPAKLMRFIASFGQSIVPSPEANPQLLKMRIYPTAGPLEANCVAIALHSGAQFYRPIVAFLSSGYAKVAGISSVYRLTASWPSTNTAAQSEDTTGTIVATSTGVRPTRTVRNVVCVDRPGYVGQATYRMERYSRALVEMTLTSHLPSTNPDGTPAEYFTRGTFINPGYYTSYGNWCLQPVAFPSAQQPEDPWLYYVSMDELYRFWLNRHELGKAHVSDALIGLDEPPVQIAVRNGLVYLIYRKYVAVYNVSTGMLTKYSVVSTLGTDAFLTSITVDRELGKVYVGHSAGVFDFTSLTVAAIDLSSISADRRVVADSKLCAVNGYIAWTSNYVMERGADAVSSFTRHRVSDGSTASWNYQDLTDMHVLTYDHGHKRSIGAVSLRSNGDVVVIYDSSRGYYSRDVSPSLLVCSVDANKMLIRKYIMPIAFGSMPYYGGQSMREFDLAQLFRVDDFHYVGTLTPVSTIVGHNDFGRENGYSSNGPTRPSAIEAFIDCTHANTGTKIRVNDFKIDEERCEIRGHSVMNMLDELQDARFMNPEGKYTGHYIGLPPYSCYVRATERLHAYRSQHVVILDKTYALFICGMQYTSHNGVDLDWSGSDWVHGIADLPRRSKTTHTNAQAVSPWLNIAFGAGNYLDGAYCYAVHTYPTRNGSPVNSRVLMYLGLLVPATYTAILTDTATTIPPASDGQEYCGIDYERPDLMTCSVNGTPLTFSAGDSTPDSTQFSVIKDVLHVHASHIGKTVEFTYSYVKAGDE
jgi:hypothetical protein